MDLAQYIPHAISTAVGAAIAYAAIKADLREALITARDAKKTAGEAHTRIDTILTHQGNKT